MPRSIRICVLALLLAVVATGCGSQRAAIAPSDLRDSVVRIAGTACLKPILATGFVVEKGTIVTVAHAVAGAEADLGVITASGASHAVEVVSFNEQLDIAILSVDGLNGTPLPAGEAIAGDPGVIGAMTPESTIELIDYEVLRIVNARSGDIYNEGAVERTAIDVRTNAGRGTSGAPLLNDAGRYVGMVFAISRDRDDGVFALAASEILDYLATSNTDSPAGRGRCR